MKNVILLLIMMLGIQNIIAQKFTADNSNSKLAVTGTSTLHDWECYVKEFKGVLSLTIENGEIISVENFNFQFNVKSLESGKGLMNKKTYDALKEEKNPVIAFTYKEVKLLGGNKASFIGLMKMAGVERKVVMPVQIQVENGSLKLTGEQAFLLSYFEIEPPTALMGTIKTGDEVVIHYDIKLNTANL